MWRPIGAGKKLGPGQPLTTDDFEVLLVHRPRYRDWSWPKGKAELNEPMPVTAVREVEEETGQVIRLGATLTTQRYRLGSGQTKEVYYWSAKHLGQTPARRARPPMRAASRKEIDIVKWCKPGKAKQLLTRRGDRRLLTEVVARAAVGELDTSTIMLVRHAKAVSREKWGGSEADRPLTRLGNVQALDMIPTLSAYGADHLTSSPWARCVETLAPYGVVSGLEIVTDEVLDEDHVAKDPAASSALVKKVLSKKRGTHVISLHQPGLKALLQPIISKRGAYHFPVLDQPEGGLRKAEMLVIHVSHAEGPWVVGIERHYSYAKLARKLR